jgi:hypothetical protein
MTAVADVTGAVATHLREQLGPTEPVRACVTFLGVAPLDVLRFGPTHAGVVHYASVGCSRHPMGEPAELVADPVRGPRAELVLRLNGGVDGVQRTLAVLAATPAVEGLVLVPDALIDLGEPLWTGAAFTAVLLQECAEVPDLELGEPLDPVRFLQVVPVTATEAAWVRLRGAPALRQAWAQANIDVYAPGRSAVSL